MGIIYAAVVSEFTLDTNERTVLQIEAPSDRGIEIVRWGISCEGTAANEPGNIQLLEQTTAGTMTGASEAQVTGRQNAVAAGATAQHSATAEPTSGDEFEQHLLTPNGGLVIAQYLPNERPALAATERIGITAHFANAVDVSAFIWWEE